jgi:hypothetical protein
MSRLVRCSAIVATSAVAAWSVVQHPAIAAPGAPAADSVAHPAPYPALGTQRPADGTSRFAMEIQPGRDSAFRALGTMTVTQQTIVLAGDSAVRRIIVYDYGARGRVIDTTLSVARTLAPIAERTYKTSGVIVLDFAGRHVTGRMGSTVSPRPIDDTLPGPAFNSTDLELVVRVLPLRAGFTADLPIYDPEFGGYRFAKVSVIGIERGAGGAGPGWRVRARDTRLESIYLVDQATRELRSIDIDASSAGARYRIRRVSAIPARQPDGMVSHVHVHPRSSA